MLGRVDLPLGSLVKQYGRPGDRFHEVASAAWKLQTAVKDALAGSEDGSSEGAGSDGSSDGDEVGLLQPS